MRIPTLLLAALAAGCNFGKDDDTEPIFDDTGDGEPGDLDGDGWSVAQGDCDDGDATVNPDATETWYDGIDQDCEGDDDYDADADTWPVDQDCDDADLAVTPEADEVCGNGVDDDCNGILTGCGPWQDASVEEADAVVYGETAGVRLGQGDPGVAGIGDVNGDGAGDLLLASIFESSVATEQGAVYVVHGPLVGARDVDEIAAAKLTGDAAQDWTGRSVAGMGDLDGDGYDDILVGEPQDDTVGADAGVAWLLYGPVSGSGDIATLADAALLAEAAGDFAGEVGRVGDVDGDGAPDVLLSAQFNGNAGEGAGAVYLFTGKPTGDTSLGTAEVRLYGTPGDEAGSSLWGAGDVDGDGLADVIVAARGDDEAGEDAGAAFLFLGPMEGVEALAQAHAKLTGEGAGAQIGWGVSVCGAGDTNADGYGDLVIGARHDDEAAVDAGGAYVVVGPVPAGTMSLAEAGFKLLGETADDYTGDSVHGPGDLDGDGYDDVIVGSGYNDLGAENAGAVYLVRGPITGGMSLANAQGILRGRQAEDRLRGRGGGDVNGDGLPDILVTAQLDGWNGDEAGAVFLFNGSGW